MPRFRTTMIDGSTYESEAQNGDQAKQAAKRQALNNTGATARTDPRVKVASVVNLDEDAGPTDPRNQPQPGAGAPRSDRGRDDRERAGNGTTRDNRESRDREDRERRERESATSRDREDRERRDREERDRMDREDRERREREGGRS